MVGGYSRQNGQPPESDTQRMRAILHSRAPAKTHYEILGLPPASSYEQLHARYRALAEQHHPDKGGDAEAFKEIALAWGILRDSASRKRYDAMLYLEGNQCTACKGAGFQPAYVKGRYNKNARCRTCGGTGKAQ
jgi:DnaJ-class molecular chaperone